MDKKNEDKPVVEKVAMADPKVACCYIIQTAKGDQHVVKDLEEFKRVRGDTGLKVKPVYE